MFKQWIVKVRVLCVDVSSTRDACGLLRFTVYVHVVCCRPGARSETTRRHRVYVVCERSSTIKMHTADTLSPLGKGIHVKGTKDPWDTVTCRRDRRLYVADRAYTVSGECQPTITCTLSG